jgi:dephospho-CoA kinase
MFKKNVFESFQKVGLNITIMDDISHQIVQKFGNRGTLV